MLIATTDGGTVTIRAGTLDIGASSPEAEALLDTIRYLVDNRAEQVPYRPPAGHGPAVLVPDDAAYGVAQLALLVTSIEAVIFDEDPIPPDALA